MRPQYEQITWWTVLWCWNILLLSLINYFILLPDPLPPPLCTPPSGPPRRSSYTIRKKKNENNRRRRLDKFKKQMTGKHHPSSHSFATYYIGREGRNKKIKILLRCLCMYLYYNLINCNTSSSSFLCRESNKKKIASSSILPQL